MHLPLLALLLFLGFVLTVKLVLNDLYIFLVHDLLLNQASLRAILVLIHLLFQFILHLNKVLLSLQILEHEGLGGFLGAESHLTPQVLPPHLLRGQLLFSVLLHLHL